MKPMLAARDAKIEELRYPLLASPKLDGVRAIVLDGAVVSRKLESFPNPHVHRLFGDVKLNNFDGELIVGSPTDDQVRNITSGAMNRRSGEPDVWFHVFDIVDTAEPYEARYKVLEKVVPHWVDEGYRIKLVEHTLVENAVNLMAFENDCLEMGYEGVIVRALDKPYKYGRSTLREGGMIKLKRFVDAEAQVLAVNEEMRNTNKAEKDNLGRTKRSKAKAGLVAKGRAGELEVVGTNGTFKGVNFVVPLGGAGDAGKEWWWAHRQEPQRVITYRYFPKGVKDKPLLPTYVGVREGWDR
jgi:DNA ligase-1